MSAAMAKINAINALVDGDVEPQQPKNGGRRIILQEERCKVNRNTFTFIHLSKASNHFST